jgi:hypothetical protein
VYDDESSGAVLLKFSGIDWVGYPRKMSPRETCLACERTERKIKRVRKMQRHHGNGVRT